MVKVIFWQYFVFDPIFFLHLRDITSLLWRSWFNLEIYVQWSEVGRPAWRLDIILFLGKKSFDTITRSVKYLIASMFIFPRRTRIRFGSVQIGLDMVHGERFWFFQLFARSYQEYYPLIIPPPPGPEDLGISSDWTYLKIARLSQFLTFQDPQSYSGSLRYGCKTGSQMINK